MAFLLLHNYTDFIVSTLIKKIINPLLVVSYTYILTHLTFLRNTVIMIIIKILLRK